jgi:hypothetical protein
MLNHSARKCDLREGPIGGLVTGTRPFRPGPLSDGLPAEHRHRGEHRATSPSSQRG